MPFESKAQQGYMFSHPEILGKAGLKEWSHATDYSHLPEHVHPKPSGQHAHASYKLAHGK
jgi:hypothetical protein